MRARPRPLRSYWSRKQGPRRAARRRKQEGTKMRGGAFLVVLAGVIGWQAALVRSVDAAPTKPAVIWKPAAAGNYTKGRGHAIDMIVIHDIEGTAPGAASWFA